jgi:uncharacterized membrane protein
LVTGEIKTSAMIVVIEFVLKFMTYYGHERAWNFVR